MTMPSQTVPGRGSQVTELPGGEPPLISEVEKLLDMVARRDKLIDQQVEQIRRERETMAKVVPRLAYLTTLLIAINESETTKAQFEELLMTLALTVPDRLELTNKMKNVAADYLLPFLEDKDLK